MELGVAMGARKPSAFFGGLFCQCDRSPPFKNSKREQTGGEALGCASELGSVLPDFNYSIIIGVRAATLAHQF